EEQLPLGLLTGDLLGQQIPRGLLGGLENHASLERRERPGHLRSGRGAAFLEGKMRKMRRAGRTQARSASEGTADPSLALRPCVWEALFRRLAELGQQRVDDLLVLDHDLAVARFARAVFLDARLLPQLIERIDEVLVF